jgi:heme/copper-type cytochrome/quinol oxidase subunit 3
VVFAVFFATFLVERRKALGQFELARTTMRTGIGFTNTLVLLTSLLLLAVSEYVALLGAGPGLRYCSWPSVPFGAS